MSNVTRLLRGLLPVLVAAAALTAAGLPAAAATGPADGRARGELADIVTGQAGEWWLGALGIPVAGQGAGLAGRGVTVAVLSTGVDGSVPDLSGSVTAGPDYSRTGRYRGGPFWGEEGTAVASLIAGHGHGPGRSGRAAGADGITGVAPGARILSVQVTLEYDDPLTADPAVTRRLPAAIAAGIRYAVNRGASVIALPLDPGALDPSADATAAGGDAAERAAVGYALARDVVLVAPAGDNGGGRNADNYPAAYPGVVAVGATTQAGQLAAFTGRHSYVALTAPGAGLTAAAAYGGYQPLASTDLSAALTAGVAAVIRAHYPRLTAAQVRQALDAGATAPGSGARGAASGWGHGQLSAARAVAAAAAAAARTAPGRPGTSSAAPPAASASARPSAAARPAPRYPLAQELRGQQDPGRSLRLLVGALALAAGALIVCLAVVLAVARARRRRQAALAGGTAAGTRAGRTGARARHARGQPLAPVPAGPPRPTARAAFPAYVQAAAYDRPSSYVQPAPSYVQPGSYPWPPAREPGRPASPDNFLPAEPAGPFPPASLFRPAGPAMPPSARPAPPVRARRPTSNSGPLYVWNPDATTAPLDLTERNRDDAAGPPAG